MIALICLLAFLGLSNCLEELPSRREIEMSINRTIEEVERMVRADPSLPRLSRSEIVDILLNITSSDMDNYSDHVQKTREDYQRALMVVLPYSAKDSQNDSINDLFTKAPHIRLLTDSPESPKSARIQSTNSPITSQTNSINTATKITDTRYKNHRDIYTEVSSEPPTEEALRKLLNNDVKQTQSPEKFTFDLARFDSSKSSTVHPTPSSLTRNRVATTSRSNLEIVYSTSVTENPTTTETIKTTESDPDRSRPTPPPTGSTVNVLTSDQWRYNAPPSTTIQPNVIGNDRKTTHHFLPTMMTGSDATVAASTTTETKTTTVGGGVDSRRNEEAESDMANLRIVMDNEKPAPLYVTPMSTSVVKLVDFITESPAVIKSTTPMREEVQTLLASIGLRPKEETSIDKRPSTISEDQDDIFGSNFRVPEIKDVTVGRLSDLEAVGVGSPSGNRLILDQAPEDVRQGVSNLSPEVQLLFQRFGLRATGTEVVPTTTTLRPRTSTGKVSHWNSFKPLPASEIRDEGMKDFLAKFGLGTVVRNEKAMKERKSVEERPSLIEAVPGNMRQILENIGLIRKPVKSAVPKVVLGTTVQSQLHVFKPHETLLDDEKQRTKINALLDTVKQVQEGKADAVAVQKAAKELLATTKSLKSGPDPLSLDEILKIYNDDVKNEIKRQQDPKDLAEMATSEIPETSSTTSAPDSTLSSTVSASTSSDTGSALVDFLGADLPTGSKSSATAIEETTTANSNLDALAESFGGSTVAPDPVLPTRRKTGLYFLVDWNTFLEVGEDGNDKVNLRFQPKVGDRTRFLPVTVP